MGAGSVGAIGGGVEGFFWELRGGVELGNGSIWITLVSGVINNFAS